MTSPDEIVHQQMLGSLLEHRAEMFLAGEWLPSDSGEMMDTIDPSTEAVLATVPKASATDVDRAVDAEPYGVVGRIVPFNHPMFT